MHCLRLIFKIGFSDKNMVFEDDVKRILEKYKGNVIDDSLIKTIVREYANTFSCWDVSKYYSEDNNEEMTEEVDDSKRKIKNCEERLRQAEDDIQRIKSGCSPLYYTLSYQRR
jgi:hypothetical protein